MTDLPLGFDEFGKIKRVLLRNAGVAFVDQQNIAAQWRGLNYIAPPDFDRAVDEFEAFVQLLKSFDMVVEYMDAELYQGLDSIYVRDASIVAPDGMILCRMGKQQRSAEPEVSGNHYRSVGLAIKGTIQGEGRLEGGDVVWLDQHTVAVGRGYRTNDEGIRQLKNLLGAQVDVIIVPLPHWRGEGDVFHLMSMLSPVDRDLALVYSPLLPIPFRELLLQRDIELVEVPADEFETMACNVLTVAPRQCLMLAGNPRTRVALEGVGVEVHEYIGNEISAKGCGGPTCLTRPLARDGGIVDR
ncbi:MAG: arginine deiminase family protein [Gammaproteobacteria bacterium]|nr:arginine deiminase family protein [Gammaproteobacteria bacterium]